MLGALGTFVRDFATRIYRVVSEARGESIVWVPSGLDRYDGESRLAVLEEALQLDKIPIPSATFRKTIKTEVALRLLPNLPPETADVIRNEIHDGVTEEERRRDDLHAVMTDLRDAGPEIESEAPRVPPGNAGRGSEAARPPAMGGAGGRGAISSS